MRTGAKHELGPICPTMNVFQYGSQSEWYSYVSVQDINATLNENTSPKSNKILVFVKTSFDKRKLYSSTIDFVLSSSHLAGGGFRKPSKRLWDVSHSWAGCDYHKNHQRPSTMHQRNSGGRDRRSRGEEREASTNLMTHFTQVSLNGVEGCQVSPSNSD